MGKIVTCFYVNSSDRSFFFLTETKQCTCHFPGRIIVEI
jgi:hypothetical protein